MVRIPRYLIVKLYHYRFRVIDHFMYKNKVNVVCSFPATTFFCLQSADVSDFIDNKKLNSNGNPCNILKTYFAPTDNVIE